MIIWHKMVFDLFINMEKNKTSETANAAINLRHLLLDQLQLPLLYEQR